MFIGIWDIGDAICESKFCLTQKCGMQGKITLKYFYLPLQILKDLFQNKDMKNKLLILENISSMMFSFSLGEKQIDISKNNESASYIMLFI